MDVRRIRAHRAVLGLVVSLACGCASPASTGVAPGDEFEDGRQPVAGGEVAAKYKAAALLDITFSSTIGRCSGALIGAQAVLTAKHCVVGQNESPQTIFVRAPYAEAPHTTATFSSVAVHPSLDVAIVFLKQGIALPGGQPYPMPALLPVPDGTNVEVVGRLKSGVSSSSDLFFAPTTISVRDAEFYAGPPMLECGDSGGPVFAIGDPFRIVAVNTLITHATPGCKSTNDTESFYTRVDLSSALLDWIAATLTSPPPTTVVAEGDCGGIGWAGQCTGEVLAYCDEGALQTIDCGAYGGTCGSIGEEGFDCLYDEDPCGGVTYEGTCDGDVLQWCEDGALHAIDCASQGASCAWNESAQYYDCL